MPCVVASAPPSRQVLVFLARCLPHFRLGVALCDEPGSNKGRYLAYHAARQPIQVDAVDFGLPRFFRYADFHLPPIVPR